MLITKNTLAERVKKDWGGNICLELMDYLMDLSHEESLGGLPMCSCDLIQPDFWTSVDRKANKNHVCCECNREIKKGETYNYSSGKWDGTIKDYKTCKDCAEVGELLECYGLGEMYEQLWDCELIGKDEEDERKVISLDDRLEVVSQYPNLRVKIKC